MSLRMNHFLKFYRELLKHKQLSFEDNDITVIVNLKQICRGFLKDGFENEKPIFKTIFHISLRNI